ncbi:hypothetical protein J8273_0528 [Carpediemonas membranifera]|uniref:Uncharacterized protein n=1 Tax=Carpediemonas membranifera TaxID=201153 RepID=A0A8J6B439_9EUKA|nr:hypothetical protein J8273_0528 [Carpediemonas membranifera]|eukprot:KAG9395298.1 hypothetical protein J8273_0528 [Carpediemonas membranifera]
MAQIKALLEEDLFNVASSAALKHPDGPLAAAAQRRATSLFGAAVSAIDPENPKYTPLLNVFEEGNPAATVRDGQELATAAEEESGHDAPDIRQQLADEADAIAPHLFMTLLPSLDAGARLISLNISNELYGKAATHRVAIQRLREAVDEINPAIEAPNYEQLHEAALIAKIRELALIGYTKEAKAIYKAEIEADGTVDSVLDALAELDEDHDGMIITPWRAFAAKKVQPPAKSQPNSATTAGRKPQARKVSGDDPYVQFKDKSKYFIPRSLRKYCDYHGYNTSHTSAQCKALSHSSDRPSVQQRLTPQQGQQRPAQQQGQRQQPRQSGQTRPNPPPQPSGHTHQSRQADPQNSGPRKAWKRNAHTNRLESDVNELYESSDSDSDIDEVEGRARVRAGEVQRHRLPSQACTRRRQAATCHDRPRSRGLPTTGCRAAYSPCLER